MRRAYLRRHRVRLGRELGPWTGKPCHDVSDVSRRHGPAVHVTAPVRRSQFRPACNYDCSKLLITCQSKVRAIYNRARLIPSSAVCSMTGGTIRPIRIRATLRIARTLRCIRRRSLSAESIGLRPGSNSSHQCIDLVVGEHSTGTLCEGWHRSARHSIRGGTTNHTVVGDCEVSRIGQSHGCSALTVHAVASCAILSIEQIEVDHFARWHYLRVSPMYAGGTVAAGTSQ